MFLPWLLALAIATVVSACLVDRCFAIGWYYLMLTPCVVGAPLLVLLYFSVRWAGIRHPVTAAALGVAVGAGLFLLQYPCGWLRETGGHGPASEGILAQWYDYIRFRIDNDVTHKPFNAHPDTASGPFLNVVGFAAQLIGMAAIGGYYAAFATRVPFHGRTGAPMERTVRLLPASSSEQLAEALGPGGGRVMAELAATREATSFPLLALAVDHLPGTDPAALDEGFLSAKLMTAPATNHARRDLYDHGRGDLLIDRIALRPDELTMLLGRS